MLAGLLSPSVAQAVTVSAVHEITADWAGTPTPTTAPYGSTVTSEFHINTNDANDPALNDPVSNVRATLTVTNGVFVSIPPVCQTAGVTPPSAISNNGTQLLCNLGTVNEGTATVIQAPVKSNGAVGSNLSVSGTVTSDSAVAPAGPTATPPLPITGTHGMDLAISAPNQNYQGAVSPSRSGGTRQTVIVDYGLSMTAGSIPGPSSYTFDLDVSATVAGQLNNLQWEGCAPVDNSAQATGIPYSDPSIANRTNSPTCSISGSGTHYTVTVSGLDYSLQHVPTIDSLGNAISSTTNFMAAGKLTFSYTPAITQSTGVTFTATPTPFAFSDGTTQPETNTTNDSSGTTLVLPGAFSNQWAPAGAGVGRSAWDANYFAAPGASQGATFPIPGAGTSTNPGTPVTNSQLPSLSLADDVAWSTYTGPGGADLAGSCTMLSNPADFVYTQVDFYGTTGAASSNITTAHIWYRTDVINSKTETCGEPVGVAGSPWTEATLSPACATQTANISPVYSDDPCVVTLPPGVTAVKMTWDPAVDKQQHHTLRAWGYVPTTAVIGSDSWTTGAFNASYDTSTVFPGNPTLNNYVNLSSSTAVFATIPGCSYAAPACNTNGQRDAMRIQGANGVITKTTPDTTAQPGVPVTYNLTAEADLAVASPPAQTFPVVDTLPTGMTYMAGSGTPTPVVTTNGSGQQVLTWTFTAVPANTAQHITYQAETALGSSIAPGTVLTNRAEIDVPGDNRPAAAKQATASVTVPNNGATTLGKSAEANVLSFYGDSSAWDLTITSQDPVTNPYTDTIDVLPAKGDADGTNIDGSYSITGVTAPAGATVYYTSATRASLSNDPRNASNGGTPGSVTGNTVGWTITKPANPTGIRIIGPALDPGAAQSFRIAFTTPAGTSCTTPAATDNKPGQNIVNTADTIAGHTALRMLSSATTTIGDCYALDLKKYVAVPGGDPSGPVTNPADWADANTVANYQRYAVGDTVPYQIVVTNKGTGTFTNTVVTDPSLTSCGFTVATLAPGASQSNTCTAIAKVGTTVNTATATVTPPTGPKLTPNDPAGIVVPDPYQVVKTSNPPAAQPANPGDKVTYTITVSEPATSAAPFPNPSLTDNLANVVDDAAYNHDATANVGTATVIGNLLAWSAPSLMPGQSVTITYSVTVKKPDTGDHTLTNTVVTPPNTSNCSPPNTDSNCTVVKKVADLHFVKTASEATANPGDTVTYTVVVTNAGQSDFTAANPASFTDDLTNDLTDAAYNGDASATAGTVSYSSPRLSWSGPLAVGATATVTYSVKVNNPDIGPHDLVNPITSTIGNCVPPSTDPACSTNTPVSGAHFAKTASEATANPGDTVTYTVVVTNTGKVAYTAANPASFSDDLTNDLTDAAYNGDASATAGTVSYTAPNLTWSGAVPVGGSVTVTYSVKVNNPDIGPHDLVNPITSTTPGNNCPTGSTDPACSTNTPVSGAHFAKTASEATANPGDTVTYTVVVTNTGKVAYTAANPASFSDDLTNDLTDAAYNGDASATAGTVSYTAPNLTWSGAVPVGGSVTVTYSVKVNNPDIGPHDLVNPITSTIGNCVPPSTDPACSTNTPVSGAHFAKTASEATANPGDTVTYTVVVTNTGKVAYTAANPASFSDDLTNDLTDAAYNGDASATAGTVSYTAPNLTWSGAVPVGGSVTVTYSVKVDNPDTGPLKLVNPITSTIPGTNCSPPSTDRACSTITIVGTPSVSLLKTAKVSPAADQNGFKVGDTIAYTFKVTNTGNVDLNVVAVSDPAGGAVTCPVPAAPGLAPGASETCTGNTPHVVTASDLTAGKVTDTATATGIDTGGKISAPSDPSTAVVPATTAAAAPPATPSAGRPATITLEAPNGLGAISTDRGRWLPGGRGAAVGLEGAAGIILFAGIGLMVARRRRRRHT